MLAGIEGLLSEEQRAEVDRQLKRNSELLEENARLHKLSAEYHKDYLPHMQKEEEFFSRYIMLEVEFKEHIASENRRRDEERIEREKRDILYSTRWTEHEKRIDDKFTELHSSIIPIVRESVSAAVNENIKPVREYLFGNGDDKNCVARKFERIESYIETQQKNWISRPQLITWLFVAISIAITLFHK